MKIWVISFLLLTINPVSVLTNQPRQDIASVKLEATPSTQTGNKQTPEQRMIVIKALITAYALEYGVEPATALAVAHIESRKGRDEFRVGLMGKTYYGPFALHKCFLVKWNIAELDTNIRVGVSALRGPDLRRTLRRYNAEFTESYWQAILKAREKYRREGVG